MTHGVFVEALRDAMVFAAFIIGAPAAAGRIWNAATRGRRRNRMRRDA